jgi:hypothetical protein
MSQIFQEVPAEIMRSYINRLTNDNAVLLTAGNIHLFNSSVASCYFVLELTCKPVAICFIRPQKHAMRFIDKNESFTLSYLPVEHRYMLDYFKSGSSTRTLSEQFRPLSTRSGNVFYPQARLVLECRKVFNPELFLLPEVQLIMSTEQAREVYPGNEVPRMYAGEIENCWLGVQALLDM